LEFAKIFSQINSHNLLLREIWPKLRFSASRFIYAYPGSAVHGTSYQLFLGQLPIGRPVGRSAAVGKRRLLDIGPPFLNGHSIFYKEQ
jgi:hypothetical protein